MFSKQIARSPRLSRTLLLPGPLPPHSHFGVTLLRHVVVTGLRSALHRLGLPLLETAPVRIVELRLYLDRDALADALGDHPGTCEALAALLDPAGAAPAAPDAARLAGAALFHRTRLLVPRRLRPPVACGTDLWADFRQALSALLPALSDAMLAELVASLARRRSRAAGRVLAACLGNEAWRFCRRRPARLDCLGPPEPLLPSWKVRPEEAERARTMLPAESPPRHRTRGRFREQYRAALDLLAPRYRRLAESATERGLLDDPSDAFFLPFDVAEDLEAERRPEWLAPAVAANRREYMAQRAAAPPPDAIDPDGPPPTAPWELAPLTPLA